LDAVVEGLLFLPGGEDRKTEDPDLFGMVMDKFNEFEVVRWVLY